jgi:hypothetical protein
MTQDVDERREEKTLVTTPGINVKEIQEKTLVPDGTRSWLSRAYRVVYIQ